MRKLKKKKKNCFFFKHLILGLLCLKNKIKFQQVFKGRKTFLVLYFSQNTTPTHNCMEIKPLKVKTITKLSIQQCLYRRCYDKTAGLSE